MTAKAQIANLRADRDSWKKEALRVKALLEEKTAALVRATNLLYECQEKGAPSGT